MPTPTTSARLWDYSHFQVLPVDKGELGFSTSKEGSLKSVSFVEPTTGVVYAVQTSGPGLRYLNIDFDPYQGGWYSPSQTKVIFREGDAIFDRVTGLGTLTGSTEIVETQAQKFTKNAKPVPQDIESLIPDTLRQKYQTHFDVDYIMAATIGLKTQSEESVSIIALCDFIQLLIQMNPLLETTPKMLAHFYKELFEANKSGTLELPSYCSRAELSMRLKICLMSLHHAYNDTSAYFLNENDFKWIDVVSSSKGLNLQSDFSHSGEDEQRTKELDKALNWLSKRGLIQYAELNFEEQAIIVEPLQIKGDIPSLDTREDWLKIQNQLLSPKTNKEDWFYLLRTVVEEVGNGRPLTFEPIIWGLEEVKMFMQLYDPEGLPEIQMRGDFKNQDPASVIQTLMSRSSPIQLNITSDEFVELTTQAGFFKDELLFNLFYLSPSPQRIKIIEKLAQNKSFKYPASFLDWEFQNREVPYIEKSDQQKIETSDQYKFFQDIAEGDKDSVLLLKIFASYNEKYINSNQILGITLAEWFKNETGLDVYETFPDSSDPLPLNKIDFYVGCLNDELTMKMLPLDTPKYMSIADASKAVQEEDEDALYKAIQKINNTVLKGSGYELLLQNIQSGDSKYYLAYPVKVEKTEILDVEGTLVSVKYVRNDLQHFSNTAEDFFEGQGLVTSHVNVYLALLKDETKLQEADVNHSIVINLDSKTGENLFQTHQKMKVDSTLSSKAVFPDLMMQTAFTTAEEFIEMDSKATLAHEAAHIIANQHKGLERDETYATFMEVAKSTEPKVILFWLVNSTYYKDPTTQTLAPRHEILPNGHVLYETRLDHGIGTETLLEYLAWDFGLIEWDDDLTLIYETKPAQFNTIMNQISSELQKLSLDDLKRRILGYAADYLAPLL